MDGPLLPIPTRERCRARGLPENRIAPRRRRKRRLGLLIDLLKDGPAQGVIHRHCPAPKIRESLLQNHFPA